MIAVLMFVLLTMQEGAVSARVVGIPEAPAVLIGDACAPTPEQRASPRTVSRQELESESDAIFGTFQSNSFTCAKEGCDVAIVPKADNGAVASVDVGIVFLGERGRYYSGSLLNVPMRSRTCHGTSVARIPVRSSLIRDGALIYVSAVRFENGSDWKMPDPSEFASAITARWQKRFHQ